tara:strand:+ start:1554 stop:1982 length:429 start_codon:yes stop_codon:yes gene_type:complete
MIGVAMVHAEGSGKRAGSVKAPAAAKVVTGEVVDLKCYVKAGDKGPAHAACAKGCIAAGGPVGLLMPAGDVVLLAPDEKMRAHLAAHAAQKVTLSGKVSERSGVTIMTGAKLAEAPARGKAEGSSPKAEGSGHKHEGSSHKH